MNKKWIFFFAKALISIGLVWVLFTNIDFDNIKGQITHISISMMSLALISMLTQILIGGMRWKVALDAFDNALPLKKLVRFFHIGLFFNQTLPSSVGGDPVRMLLAYRNGLSVNSAISGVMLERLATVIGLVLIVIIFLPLFLPNLDPTIARWGYPLMGLTLAGLTGGLAFLLFLDRLPRKLHAWKFIRGISILSRNAKKVFLKPGNLTKILFWSIIGQFNIILSVYFIAMGLGLKVSFLDCMILTPPAILISTLPISIAGWGIRESTMVFTFGLIGVPTEGALALSILLGILSITASLPGGFLWLSNNEKNKSLSESLETLRH